MTARYELPPGTALRVTASSGDVTVIAEERSDVEAPEGARVEARPAEAASEEQIPAERRRRKRRGLRALRRLVVRAIRGRRRRMHGPRGPSLEIRSPRGGSDDLEIRCPTGIAISVGTISGDVRLVGNFGATRIATASGDISVDRADALDVRSVSGDLEVEACSGRCRLHTKSGDIEARTTGPAEADTVSGGVTLHRTAGGVTVRTVSGDVELGTDGTEAVTIRTVSGRIAVRVPSERLPDAKLRSLSGDVEREFPQGADFLLRVDSVSGDIEVEPS